MRNILLHRWNLNLIAAFIIAAMMLGFHASGATVSSANDYPITLKTSQTSNHQVIFTTPTGVSEGQTITLTFSTSFDTSSITEDDVDVSDDSVDLTTASNCSGSERASVVMASDVLTVTICAGDGGAIAASSQVAIEIGTNATSSGTGSNKITNPTSVGTAFITIGGTFGDFGSIALPMRSGSNGVTVTATVPAPPSTGGGSAPSTPQPGDTTPPSISNIIVSGVTGATATVSWSTSEPADSAIDYGLTASFELGSVTDSQATGTHSLGVSGLSEGKTYSFRVRSKDPSGNGATSATQTFTTLDQTAPTISGITVVDITKSSARVTWSTNEASNSLIEYGQNVTYGSTKSDSSLVTDHSVTLSGLASGKSYHVRLRSTDASSNTALSQDQTFATLTDVPPANVTGFTVTAGKSQLALAWVNPSDTDLAGIRVLECTDTFPKDQNDVTGCTQVSNALVNTLTRTGLTKDNIYYYGVFVFDDAGQFSSGAVGSGTPTGSEAEVPPAPQKPEALPEAPPEGPSGQSATPTGGTGQSSPSGEEGQPQSGTGSSSGATVQPTLLGAGKAKLEREDVVVTVSGGKIVLSMGAKGTIDVLPSTRMRLAVSQDEISDNVELLQISIGSEVYLMRLASEQGGNALYVADVTTPSTPQLYLMGVDVTYAGGSHESVSSYLNVVPWGITSQVIDDEETQVSGVQVILEQIVNGNSIVWDGSPYDQFNPITTSPEGTFGWYVPNGAYRLQTSKQDFLSYRGDVLAISNHIVNPRVRLVAVPKKEELQPFAPALIQTAATLKASLEKVLSTPVAQTVQQTLQTVRENEAVQTTVDVATPAIAVTAGASVLVMTVAFDFLPFLQYLFTAPVLLLWRRKRKGFGVVYNAISRTPVDLAVVRLFRVEDETASGPGRLVKSRVTDKGGRFFFLVQPGMYRLTATKVGFRFPTDYLKEAKDDGVFLDVYHGEFIKVTEKDAVITPNVPLDPAQVGATQTPKRVVWQGRLRVVQHIVALSGVIVSIAVSIIRPNVLAAVMIAVQVVVYLLSRRLAKPRKPKSWGIVYDESTHRPLSHVVARIFEPKYNKLLDTQMTDAKGRYAFLLGPSEYYAVFEKGGYHSTQVRPIDLRHKEGSQDFGIDVELTGKKDETSV
ncbi:hypothetical protein HZA85_01955 [Candidatus Uhrbacteria bacterium]|nr:hypothetical protein [Candidatus Uhrbacteria bacterium]